MQESPLEQHRWLARWLGDWRYDAEAASGPGRAPERSSGTERVRTLGALWVVCEGTGAMPGGGPASTLMTVGYDARKARFVGTWCGSMMTHLWVYEGDLDAAGRVLSLDSEGPSFTGKGTSRYRDAMELVSPDERVLTSMVMEADGRWTPFMTARYRKTG